MREDRAVALIQCMFPGAEVVTVAVPVPEMSLPDRCNCGRHPHKGHEVPANKRARRTA